MSHQSDLLLTSEITKHVDNAHLSTLISFWKDVHSIREKAQVQSTVVGKVVFIDPWLRDPWISTCGAIMSGQPFAGSCLPKDPDALIATGGETTAPDLLAGFAPTSTSPESSVSAQVAPLGNGGGKPDRRYRYALAKGRGAQEIVTYWKEE